MHLNIWTMIVRPNILSQDIIVNASSQTEFLYQLEALFVYVFIIIDIKDSLGIKSCKVGFSL